MLQAALVTLESWINSLPPSLVRTRPGLISLRGPLLAMKGDLRNPTICSTVLYHVSEKPGNPWPCSGTRASCSYSRLLGKYEASLKDVEEQCNWRKLTCLSAVIRRSCYKGLNLYRLGKSRNAVEEAGTFAGTL